MVSFNEIVRLGRRGGSCGKRAATGALKTSVKKAEKPVVDSFERVSVRKDLFDVLDNARQDVLLGIEYGDENRILDGICSILKRSESRVDEKCMRGTIIDRLANCLGLVSTNPKTKGRYISLPYIDHKGFDQELRLGTDFANAKEALKTAESMVKNSGIVFG